MFCKCKLFFPLFLFLRVIEHRRFFLMAYMLESVLAATIFGHWMEPEGLVATCWECLQDAKEVNDYSLVTNQLLCTIDSHWWFLVDRPWQLCKGSRSSEAGLNMLKLEDEDS